MLYLTDLLKAIKLHEINNMSLRNDTLFMKVKYCDKNSDILSSVNYKVVKFCAEYMLISIELEEVI